MSSIFGKIKAPFQQAHQTPSGRAKITLIPLSLIAMGIFGALAVHGYFDLDKTGLEPLKFAGNYLIEGNNPLYFGIPFAVALIGSLGYIAKAPKPKEQQNFPHPAPVDTNSGPHSPSNTSIPQTPAQSSPASPNSDSPATSAVSGSRLEQQNSSSISSQNDGMNPVPQSSSHSTSTPQASTQSSPTSPNSDSPATSAISGSRLEQQNSSSTSSQNDGTNPGPQDSSNSSASMPQAPLSPPTSPNSGSLATNANSNLHSEQQNLNQTPHYTFSPFPGSTASLYPGFRTNVSAASSSSSSSAAETGPTLNGLERTLDQLEYQKIPCYNYPPNYREQASTPEKIAQRRKRFFDCESTYGLKRGQMRELPPYQGYHGTLVKYFDRANKLEAYTAIFYSAKQRPALMTLLNNCGFQMTHNPSPITLPGSLTSVIDHSVSTASSVASSTVSSSSVNSSSVSSTPNSSSTTTSSSSSNSSTPNSNKQLTKITEGNPKEGEFKIIPYSYEKAENQFNLQPLQMKKIKSTTMANDNIAGYIYKNKKNDSECYYELFLCHVNDLDLAYNSLKDKYSLVSTPST